MKQEKIDRFTDLKTWQEAHKLAILVYGLVKKLPKDEQFGLSMQMRRSAVSITSNIAEGFSRATREDKRHFYLMAKGSLTELQNQSLLCRDVKYINQQDFQHCADQSVLVLRLLIGLIRSIESGKGVKN